MICADETLDENKNVAHAGGRDLGRSPRTRTSFRFGRCLDDVFRNETFVHMVAGAYDEIFADKTFVTGDGRRSQSRLRGRLFCDKVRCTRSLAGGPSGARNISNC